MQYAVHLTVRRRVQAFRVRKSRWAKIKLAKEKERGREKPHMQLNPSQSILCCQFFDGLCSGLGQVLRIP